MSNGQCKSVVQGRHACSVGHEHASWAPMLSNAGSATVPAGHYVLSLDGSLGINMLNPLPIRHIIQCMCLAA